MHAAEIKPDAPTRWISTTSYCGANPLEWGFAHGLTRAATQSPRSYPTKRAGFEIATPPRAHPPHRQGQFGVSRLSRLGSPGPRPRSDWHSGRADSSFAGEPRECDRRPPGTLATACTTLDVSDESGEAPPWLIAPPLGVGRMEAPRSRCSGRSVMSIDRSRLGPAGAGDGFP